MEDFKIVVNIVSVRLCPPHGILLEAIAEFSDPLHPDHVKRIFGPNQRRETKAFLAFHMTPEEYESFGKPNVNEQLEIRVLNGIRW